MHTGLEALGVGKCLLTMNPLTHFGFAQIQIKILNSNACRSTETYIETLVPAEGRMERQANGLSCTIPTSAKLAAGLFYILKKRKTKRPLARRVRETRGNDRSLYATVGPTKLQVEECKRWLWQKGRRAPALLGRGAVAEHRGCTAPMTIGAMEECVEEKSGRGRGPTRSRSAGDSVACSRTAEWTPSAGSRGGPAPEP